MAKKTLPAPSSELTTQETLEHPRLRVTEETVRLRAANAAAKRAECKRKREAGLVVKQLWVYPSDWPKIRALADTMTAKREKRDGRYPRPRALPRGRWAR